MPTSEKKKSLVSRVYGSLRPSAVWQTQWKIGGNSIESTTSWKHLGNPIFLGTTIHGSLCLSATDACSTHHQPDHFRTHYFECSLAANSAGSRMESELVYLNRNLEKHINDIAKHIIDRFNKLLT